MTCVHPNPNPNPNYAQYHHNFDDILAGLCLGSVIAFLVNMLNYPPVWAADAGEPKMRTVIRAEEKAPLIGASAPLPGDEQA